MNRFIYKNWCHKYNMSRKTEVNRLEKEELCYELKWRGIATGTVEEMRGRLALARRMEKTGESLHYPPYPFSFQEDEDAVTNKLDSLGPVIDAFSDSSKSGSFVKLQTKLNHILDRLDNMVCSTKEEFESRGVLVARTLTCIDELNKKAADFDGRNKPSPPNLSVLQNVQQPQNLQAVGSPPSPTGNLPLTSTPTFTPASCSNVKPILPHKWNIKFGGDKTSMSVTAFFERVEELRRARNVTKDVLLESGIDLFEGRAYEFYQDCRNEVRTWDELVSKFKEEYQPAFYSEKLLE